jgi:hypothetical protein
VPSIFQIESSAVVASHESDYSKGSEDDVSPTQTPESSVPVVSSAHIVISREADNHAEGEAIGISLEIERFSGVKADDEVDVSSEDPLLRSQNEVIHTVEAVSDAADGMEDDLLKPELEPIADEELIDVFEADIDLLPFEFDADGPRTRQAQLEGTKYQFGFGFETIEEDEEDLFVLCQKLTGELWNHLRLTVEPLVVEAVIHGSDISVALSEFDSLIGDAMACDEDEAFFEELERLFEISENLEVVVTEGRKVKDIIQQVIDSDGRDDAEGLREEVVGLISEFECSYEGAVVAEIAQALRALFYGSGEALAGVIYAEDNGNSEVETKI